jgi:FKBP-type peptidyl-prolyl cis-trans isomerase
MKLSPLFAFGALLLCGAATLPVVLQDDPSNLPEPLQETAAKVRAHPVKLAEAVALAESTAGGLARSAELSLTDGSVEVKVYTESSAYRVKVGAGPAVLEKSELPPFKLPGAAVDGEPTKLPSGLMYYELVPGDGPSPPNSAARVRVHYTGWLLNGEEFDSSVRRGTPLVFPLNGVIPGWTEGVGSMKVGGKRKLIIPHTLAYGERGSPPVIPARAMLVFDVELIELVQ